MYGGGWRRGGDGVNMQAKAEWIAVDWGTSRLRVWAMAGNRVLARAQSDNGMSGLDKSEFEPALQTLIDPWIGDAPIDVICCGMVGARQGWVEAPYTAVPATPLSPRPVRVADTDGRLRVFVVPGLKQVRPADVMRGEETQVAGLLAQNPNWDGVICLPGTHTKWVHVSAGEVVSFRSFMTGELFDLLSTSSVLRHSVVEGWDEAAFLDGLDSTISRPESLAAALFGIRASDLLEARDRATAYAHLSGLLIGAELASARHYWLGQNLAVIGAAGLSDVYVKALQQQGCEVVAAECEIMTIAGLSEARNLLRGKL